MCFSVFFPPWSTGAAAPAVFPFILGGARAPQYEQTRSMLPLPGHKDDGSPVVPTRDREAGLREPRPSALAFCTASRSKHVVLSGLRAHTPAVKCVFRFVVG